MRGQKEWVEEVGRKNILFLILGEFALKNYGKDLVVVFLVSVVVLRVRGGGIVCLRVS